VSDDWCGRCDLPAMMCEHRAAAAPRGAEPDWDLVEDLAVAGAERENGPTIEATYHQSCPGCAGHVEPGDLITFSEGEGAWVCGGCAGETRR
jgi:hypothetical protein